MKMIISSRREEEEEEDKAEDKIFRNKRYTKAFFRLP